MPCWGREGRADEFAAAYQSEREPGGLYGALKKVEPIRLEPTTSCMPCLAGDKNSSEHLHRSHLDELLASP